MSGKLKNPCFSLFHEGLVLLLTLVLFSCVDVEVHTSLKANGSGKQSWKFMTTALMAGELKKQIESDPYFKDRAKIRDEFKEGDYILYADLDFRNVEELSDKGREMRFEKSGFFKTTVVYTEAWKRNFLETSSILAKRAESIVPVTLTVSVEMPGEIFESNAETIEGSIARWSFPLNDLSGTKVLRVQSRSWNWAVIIPLWLFLIAGAGAVVFRIAAGRGKSATASLLCPACRTPNPPKASYCNHCGKKMVSEAQLPM